MKVIYPLPIFLVIHEKTFITISMPITSIPPSKYSSSFFFPQFEFSLISVPASKVEFTEPISFSFSYFSLIFPTFRFLLVFELIFFLIKFYLPSCHFIPHFFHFFPESRLLFVGQEGFFIFYQKILNKSFEGKIGNQSSVFQFQSSQGTGFFPCIKPLFNTTFIESMSIQCEDRVQHYLARYRTEKLLWNFDILFI